MIKPATLWGLFKTCDDSKWLGDICRALGGQEVEGLEYGQRQMVKTIQLDSGWLDEAVEAQRAKWREKKRGQRGTFETLGDKGDISSVPECPPPSVHPSSRSISQTYIEGEVQAPASLETMILGGGVIGVPEWYTRWWYNRMDGVWKSGNKVVGSNWREVLKAWYFKEDSKKKAEIEAEYRQMTKAAQVVEEEFDTDPNHWRACVSSKCKWLYTCGYGCKYCKRPPQAGCPKFEKGED